MAGSLRSLVICAGLGLGLSACAPGSDYAAPSFPFLQGYSQTQDPAPVLLSNAAWWQTLEDPTLDRLIALGLRDNLSLAEARERVTQARASREALGAAASLSPSAQITASGTDPTRPDVTGMARLGLSWILDPYGARRAEREGAEARIRQAAAERDAAQLLVVFNILEDLW